MRLTVPGSAPTVLVTHPGPRVAETVHDLVRQGAVVWVEDAAPPASLVDLASRSLVTIVAGADVTAYDVVLRDPHRDRGAEQGPAADRETAGPGRVVLVGGGPGDPGLLTVAGLQAVRSADVIVCDRLAPLAVLEEARPGVEVVHVGKIPRGAFTPQEAINDLLVDRAARGATVVRLKGGDSYVFGRGGEEWAACAAHGIPVEVVPGVTSAVAVPALAGIPVTHRGLTQGFVVVSGHVAPGDPRSEVEWASLATARLTLVILMGVSALAQIAEVLIGHGMDPATPAACVADGSMPSMRVARAPLAHIAAAADARGVTAPSVTVIGDVTTALEENA